MRVTRSTPVVSRSRSFEDSVHLEREILQFLVTFDGRTTALPGLSSREISYVPSKTHFTIRNSSVVVETNSLTEVLGTLKNVGHQFFSRQ